MNKNVSLLIVIIVVVISMLTVAALWQSGVLEGVFGVMEYDPDTSTNEYSWDAYTCGFTLRGTFTDPLTGDTDELLDTSAYVSSWKAGGASEKIVILGVADTHIHHPPCWWEYDWYKYNLYYVDSTVDPSTDGWGDPIYSSGKLTTWPVSWINHLYGPKSGYIKAEMVLRIDRYFPHDDFTCSISDEAIIHSGIGSVYVEEETYEEGETVVFHLDTGASGKTVGELDKGWVLRLYNPDGVQYTGQDWPKDIPDFSSNYKAYWTIPGGTWRPFWYRWHVELYNTLISEDACSFAVVDLKKACPPEPTISVSNERPEKNEPVLVTLHGEPNDGTMGQITNFSACVYYGTGVSEPGAGSDDWIIPWRDYDAAPVGGNAGEVAFSFVPTVGDRSVIIKAYSCDQFGRPSIGYAIHSIDVIDPDPPPPPPEYYKKPGETFRFYLDERFYFNTFLWGFDTMKYEVLDDDMDIIYIWKEKPDGVESIDGGVHVTSLVKFTVPCWPHEYGNWTIICKAIDEKPIIGDKQLGDSHYEHFVVVEGSFWDNIWAPYYIHELFGFEVDWKLPLHPLVILMWVAIAIVAIAAIYIYLVRAGKIKPIRLKRKPKSKSRK